MNPNKVLWEKGDFTRIAKSMRASGADFVSKIGITEGMQVMDLGCGDGTTAIPAAKLGAVVTGVDIAQNLVAAGNTRVQTEGVRNCRFREGDACDLKDIEGALFDRTVSVFGAMFSIRPFDVAKEMVRVTRPGGKIIMGNWIPGDPTLVAQILRISSAYTPPPPEGFISPMSWGLEQNVIERFGSAGVAAENIAFTRETWNFHVQLTPAEFLGEFRNYYGPTMNAFEAAEKNGKSAELQQELNDLFVSQNRSSAKMETLIPATYLKVVVNV